MTPQGKENVFEALHPEVRSLLGAQGMERPTEAQTAFIPRVLNGGNLLLVAPTGIGKTEAAVLPIISRMMERKDKDGHLPKGPYLLYITPLRALNRDMLLRLKAWGEALGFDVGVRHGDTDASERRRQSLHPPHVLITTPETLQIMFLGKLLREGLRHVEWVIVDEIHELTDNERGAQLTVALERLAIISERGFRRIGLSATVGSHDEVARFLGGIGEGREVGIVKVDAIKGMRIEVEAPEPTKQDEVLADTLATNGDMMASMRRARALVEAHTSTLLFVNTRDTAEFLSSRFRKWYAQDMGQDVPSPIEVHHGSLSKEARVEAEEGFKSGRTKGLICTSSLELGIDIGSADFTIQFISPRQTARLVQRVGRSGHAVGRTSEGTILALGPDDVAEAAAISRRAMAGELEPITVRPLPLSVLANQIIAMTLERDWTRGGMLSVLRKAYPFKELTDGLLVRVLQQLLDLRKIWVDADGTVKRRRAGRAYFFENISMIPDEKTYRIRDITTRGILGTLDENFVASYLSDGVSFIVKGRPWRIVDIQEEEVLVEPSKEEGSIPSWVGEEIPVPYGVAQEVGSLRARGDVKGYPVDARAGEIFSRYIEDQRGKHPVPTDRTWTVESGDGVVVINACLGTRMNETLARVIASFLTARFGASVGVTADPYRIIVEAPATVSGKTIMEHLMAVEPTQLHQYLRLVMRSTTFIKWQLVQTARKFGAIERDVDVRMLNVNRLMDAFADTPLFEETLDKVLWERMDVDGTVGVLRQLRSGDIKVEHTGISRIGREGLDRRRELMSPQTADMQILLAMKARLEKEHVKLGCLHCANVMRGTIGTLPERLSCPSCGGVLLAKFSPNDPGLEVLKRVNTKRMEATRTAQEAASTKKGRGMKGGGKGKGKGRGIGGAGARGPVALGSDAGPKLTKDETRHYERMRKSADIVRTYGKTGLLVLVARGVGPDTAQRILRMPYDTDEMFLRRILAAEVQYARTKRFWD